MTTLGTRYPTLAFISGGVGEAEDGIPPQPFETFCYDSALMQAKIENFNIIPYTSVRTVQQHCSCRFRGFFLQTRCRA